jgi:hypothetical protein
VPSEEERDGIPALGPGPVRNRSRRADGVANFQQLVGDYSDPVSQPWAADIVKKHSDFGREQCMHGGHGRL